MPRQKTRTKPKPEEERQEEVINPADYCDSESSLIQYGVALWRKADKQKLLTKSDCATAVDMMEIIEPKQIQYLNMLARGISSARACKALCVDRATPLLWGSQDSIGIFNQCMKIIKQMQADDLEESVWEEALNNPKSTLMKMFALKARKDEYKDNAAPALNMQTNINVTIDGVPYGEEGATIKVVEIQGDTDAAKDV